MNSWKYLMGVGLFKSSGFKTIAAMDENRMKKWMTVFQGLYKPDPGTIMEQQYDISEAEINGYKYYIVRPKDTFTDQAVLFIHGGAMFMEISFLHWFFVGRLARRLQAAVYVPIYPLLPRHTYRETKDMVPQLYKTISLRYCSQNTSIIGDSSGAGIALALAMQIKEMQLPQPSHLILISPLVSASYPYAGNEQESERLEASDPILSRNLFKVLPRLWAGDDDFTDCFINPLSGDLSQLAPITIFTGTSDILHLQARELHKKLLDAKIFHRYFIGHNLVHDYLLFNCPESEPDFEKMIEIIKS